MARINYLIISEQSIKDGYSVSTTIEQAQEYAKLRAFENPGEKYFIMEASEYAISEITPATFFNTEGLFDIEEDRPRGNRQAVFTNPIPRHIVNTLPGGIAYGGAVGGDVATQAGGVIVRNGWITATEAPDTLTEERIEF